MYGWFGCNGYKNWYGYVPLNQLSIFGGKNIQEMYKFADFDADCLAYFWSVLDFRRHQVEE